MGRGVFSVYAPGTSHETLEKGDPIFYEGFFEPPNETAHIIYEDPSFARGTTWSPLASRRSFQHFFKIFLKNIVESIRILDSFSRLSIVILIIYIVLLFVHPVKKLFKNREVLYPLLTIMLYSGGYALFHFEARYLWIVNVLLLLMGGKVLTELFQSELFKKNTIRTILLIIFILSFTITPLKTSIEMTTKNINQEMYILGTELNNRYEIKGNIASNRQKEHVSIHDSWHKTFRLSY
ncbi:MAG: hypothetical protein ACXACY_29980, partial [Candidatus Hodarchaeales archaeon]